MRFRSRTGQRFGIRTAEPAANPDAQRNRDTVQRGGDGKDYVSVRLLPPLLRYAWVRRPPGAKVTPQPPTDEN